MKEWEFVPLTKLWPGRRGKPGALMHRSHRSPRTKHNVVQTRSDEDGAQSKKFCSSTLPVSYTEVQVQKPKNTEDLYSNM
jgi:hypothetical protein